MRPNLVNGDELARIFGISRSSVTNWRAQGMPCVTVGGRGRPGQYDTVKVIQWFVAWQAGDKEILDLNEERARLAHHQADKTALEAATLKAELVRALDVLEVWQGMIAAARARFLALPRKLAAVVIHAETASEAEKALQAEIRQGLDELGRSGLPRQVERALESSGARLEAASSPDS